MNDNEQLKVQGIKGTKSTFKLKKGQGWVVSRVLKADTKLASAAQLAFKNNKNGPPSYQKGMHPMNFSGHSKRVHLKRERAIRSLLRFWISGSKFKFIDFIRTELGQKSAQCALADILDYADEIGYNARKAVEGILHGYKQEKLQQKAVESIEVGEILDAIGVENCWNMSAIFSNYLKGYHTEDDSDCDEVYYYVNESGSYDYEGEEEETSNSVSDDETEKQTDTPSQDEEEECSLEARPDPVDATMEQVAVAAQADKVVIPGYNGVFKSNYPEEKKAYDALQYGYIGQIREANGNLRQMFSSTAAPSAANPGIVDYFNVRHQIPVANISRGNWTAHHRQEYKCRIQIDSLLNYDPKNVTSYRSLAGVPQARINNMITFLRQMVKDPEQGAQIGMEYWTQLKAMWFTHMIKTHQVFEGMTTNNFNMSRTATKVRVYILPADLLLVGENPDMDSEWETSTGYSGLPLGARQDITDWLEDNQHVLQIIGDADPTTWRTSVYANVLTGSGWLGAGDLTRRGWFQLFNYAGTLTDKLREYPASTDPADTAHIPVILWVPTSSFSQIEQLNEKLPAGVDFPTVVDEKYFEFTAAELAETKLRMPFWQLDTPLRLLFKEVWAHVEYSIPSHDTADDKTENTQRRYYSGVGCRRTDHIEEEDIPSIPSSSIDFDKWMTIMTQTDPQRFNIVGWTDDTTTPPVDKAESYWNAVHTIMDDILDYPARTQSRLNAIAENPATAIYQLRNTSVSHMLYSHLKVLKFTPNVSNENCRFFPEYAYSKVVRAKATAWPIEGTAAENVLAMHAPPIPGDKALEQYMQQQIRAYELGLNANFNLKVEGRYKYQFFFASSPKVDAVMSTYMANMDIRSGNTQRQIRLRRYWIDHAGAFQQVNISWAMSIKYMEAGQVYYPPICHIYEGRIQQAPRLYSKAQLEADVGYLAFANFQLPFVDIYASEPNQSLQQTESAKEITENSAE